MTVKEMKEMLSNIPEEFEDRPVRMFSDPEKAYKEVKILRQIKTPMGNPCCIEIQFKENNE